MARARAAVARGRLARVGAPRTPSPLRLRRANRPRRPSAPRPYKALGYPVLPAVYIAMAATICFTLLRYKPQYTWPGLFLVLLGVPVYLLRSRAAQSA